MNDTLTDQTNNTLAVTPAPKRRHPYFMENTPEETIRRMKALPERIAELKKRLEKLNADRTTDAG